MASNTYGTIEATGTLPPSYDEVTNPEYAAPPSYDQLYGEFRQVRSPGGFVNFMRRCFGVVASSVAAAILIAIFSIVPIAMIAVGVYYKSDCPVNEYIPIYLIVGGVFGLLKTLTDFIYRARRRTEDVEHPENVVTPNPFDGIINCFLLAWFVAGTVWVYRVMWPNMDNRNLERFCDPVLYYFAFVMITVQYVMLLSLLVLACCCGVCALCYSAFIDD